MPGSGRGFGGGAGGGLATVEPVEGPGEASAVPVLVWDIQPDDLIARDGYEGYPSLYRKENQTVELNGEPVEAMVYIMNETRGYGTPGGFYYDVIREGYEAAGFDVGYLNQAVERSQQLAMENPDPLFGMEWKQ